MAVMAVIARARRALADAIARLLARWQRKAWERTPDEPRRSRSIQPTRQLRARSASAATPSVSTVRPPPSLPAQLQVPTPRHRIGRIGSPNLHTVTVECDCGWAVTMDRLDNAFDAFDSHAATATAHPKGKN